MNDEAKQLDYEAEYERLMRENHELSEKVETLLWALGKAKQGEKK